MTLMCRRCGLDAVKTTYKGRFAAECPNCEELLFRPVGEGIEQSKERIRDLVGGGGESR